MNIIIDFSNVAIIKTVVRVYIIIKNRLSCAHIVFGTIMLDGPQWTLLLLLCKSFREIRSFHISHPRFFDIIYRLSSAAHRARPHFVTPSADCRSAEPPSSVNDIHYRLQTGVILIVVIWVVFQYTFTFHIVRVRYRNDFYTYKSYEWYTYTFVTHYLSPLAENVQQRL